MIVIGPPLTDFGYDPNGVAIEPPPTWHTVAKQNESWTRIFAGASGSGGPAFQGNAFQITAFQATRLWTAAVKQIEIWIKVT